MKNMAQFEFEKYPALAEKMQEYASFGRFSSWQEFTNVLEGVLKEKDERIKELERAVKKVSWIGESLQDQLQQKERQLNENSNTYNVYVKELEGQLSQLQSKMEEEKRKAFEAGKAINAMNNGLSGKCIGYMKYDKDNDDFIIEPLDEDESTESGNLNKQ